MNKQDENFNKETETIKKNQTEILELEKIMTLSGLEGQGMEEMRRCWLKSANFQLWDE